MTSPQNTVPSRNSQNMLSQKPVLDMQNFMSKFVKRTTEPAIEPVTRVNAAASKRFSPFELKQVSIHILIPQIPFSSSSLFFFYPFHSFTNRDI